MSTDVNILGRIQENIATMVLQEQCIIYKKKNLENRKVLLETKTLIAAIKNSIERLEDKLRKSFRI